MIKKYFKKHLKKFSLDTNNKEKNNNNESKTESTFDIFYNTNNDDVFYLYRHKHILASYILSTEDHHIIKSFPEYNFIFISKVYGTIDLLNRYFNKIYNSEEHYDTSYNSYENIYNLMNKEKEFNKASLAFDELDSNSFDYMVHNWITSRYYITDSLSDKIKADKICKEIEHNSDINTSNRIILRNNLYKSLSKIGIHKKRYTDGYYYYGLVSKLNNNIDIDTFIQIRNKSESMSCSFE